MNKPNAMQGEVADVQKKSVQARSEVVEMIMSKQKPHNIRSGDPVENGQITKEEFAKWKKDHAYCGSCNRWIP